ncbi:NSFL1 cofactor p47 isoform X2 [Cimex lectularius]|nr:NSFL1 cofactor p47 isoform X2 [Cimex lectularius]XP_014261533.1 NSFL1 cofactor p47 isoform X2 [Cimex lectularius]
MNENETVLAGFCEITGATSEEATFFLESAAWVLEDALITYYQSWTPSEPTAPAQPTPETLTPPPMGDSDNEAPSAPRGKPKFGTLSSLRKDSSSDEEEGQRFYAGGSVHSGQEVVGPGKHSTDVISDMFKSVRDLGGVEAASTSREGKARPMFKGTGYRLGQTPDDTEVISSGHRERRRREVTLRLWRNGFSVNEGPLRSYTSPQDKEFLDKIRTGQVPQELVEDSTEESVHLNMEDHRHEEFNRPKATARAFTGQGFILGSLTPNVTTLPNPQPPQTSPVEPPSTETAPPSVDVDPSQPTTVVQVRLNDGSRLRAELNHTHTIGDLRNYLISSRPEYRQSPFMLLTTYPSKELTDNNLTLAEAGILNASILMRMK